MICDLGLGGGGRAGRPGLGVGQFLPSCVPPFLTSSSTPCGSASRREKTYFSRGSRSSRLKGQFSIPGWNPRC